MLVGGGVLLEDDIVFKLLYEDKNRIFHGCTSCQQIAQSRMGSDQIPDESHFLVGSEQAKSQFGFAKRQKAEKLCYVPMLHVLVRPPSMTPLNRFT